MNRLFFTDPAVNVDASFAALLCSFGVHIVRSSDVLTISELAEAAGRAGAEIIGCVAIDDVALAAAVARFDGIVISLGPAVSHWCTLHLNPRYPWTECTDLKAAGSFAPLQIRASRG